ncbi:MAG: metallophosphoesterase [Sphaerochaetaceae bacterium]
MKILCISDETDPLIYSKNIASRYGDVDLIISAGDLPLKYYEYIISSLNKEMYFVFGNHNLENMQQFTGGNQLAQIGMGYSEPHPSLRVLPDFGGNYIDGKVVYDKKQNLIIAGLGGSIRYNRGKNQFTEQEMRFRMYKMIPHLLYNRIRYGRYVDILVTHAAPLGINDEIDACHQGFSTFLIFMRWFKPKYLLHGHVHLLDLNEKREKVYQQTKVINIFKNYVIDDSRLGKKHGN